MDEKIHYSIDINISLNLIMFIVLIFPNNNFRFRILLLPIISEEKKLISTLQIKQYIDTTYYYVYVQTNNIWSLWNCPHLLLKYK